MSYSCDLPNSDFKNTALLVVLNSDIQGVIAKTLAQSILPRNVVDKMPEITFEKVIEMGNIFSEITSAFQTEKQHIKCLKDLKLSSWSNGIFQKYVVGMESDFKEELEKNRAQFENLVLTFLDISGDN